MAGLVAGARAAELDADPVVYERGDLPGGSMALSSGVIWRHADWSDFRAECPGGDSALQRLVWERLDDALDWLRSLDAPVVRNKTGNPRTVGVRFDPSGLTRALVARLPPGTLLTGTAAPIGLSRGGESTWRSSGAGHDQDVPLVLATGGFAASRELVARYIAPASPLRLRAARWSSGDGLRHGLARGAALSGGMDQFYGRNMPAAPWTDRDFVSQAQLYARRARIFDEDGVEFVEQGRVSWSETDVVQSTARRPNARAYYLLDEGALADPAVAGIVARAPATTRLDPAALPFPAPAGTVTAVHVTASITHTIGGLRIDDRTRVVDESGGLVPGLHAAGVDAGNIATGGYASGLAQALVLGLVAAESAVAS